MLLINKIVVLALFLCGVILGCVYLPVHSKNITPCSKELSHISAYKKLDELHVTVQEHLQQDFPSVKLSSNCYFQSWPETRDEVINLVKIAYDYNIPVRIQGGAHSQNGSSLPKYAELLINTSQLNTVSFLKENTITVGAGVNLSLLQDFLHGEKYGNLPIINGGGQGPSIGGFISAGGMGATSKMNGGFWENVEEVVLVSGGGKLLVIKKNDPLFPWLFGSMGQFGVFVQATLKLNVPSDVSHYVYPKGKNFKLELGKEDGARWIGIHRRIPLYWFTLLVSMDKVTLAERQLKELQKKYLRLFKYPPTFYYWPVEFVSIIPPLIFPEKKEFMAMGFAGYGYPQGVEGVNQAALWQLENDFGVMVQKNKYRRYIQAELSGDPSIYKAYFGEKIYEEFRTIKLKLDPKFLFNKNSVFN